MEQRTPNMLLMDMTLEVSKLSGWLNADALPTSCPESKRGRVRCGASCGLDGGRRRTQRVRGRARLHRLGAGHGK